MRGERDDGDARIQARHLTFADLTRGHVAIDVRHLAIHEHGIVAVASEQGERSGPVVGDVDAMTELLEQAPPDELIGAIVFGQQEMQAS
jgi:hypothetical protein